MLRCQKGCRSTKPQHTRAGSSPCRDWPCWCPCTCTPSCTQTSHIPLRNQTHRHFPHITTVYQCHDASIHPIIRTTSNHARQSQNTWDRSWHKNPVWQPWATHYALCPTMRSQFKCHTNGTPFLWNSNKRMAYHRHFSCITTVYQCHDESIHPTIWTTSNHAGWSQNTWDRSWHKNPVWQPRATHYALCPTTRSQFKCHPNGTPLLQNSNKRMAWQTFKDNWQCSSTKPTSLQKTMQPLSSSIKISPKFWWKLINNARNSRAHHGLQNSFVPTSSIATGTYKPATSRQAKTTITFLQNFAPS